MNARVRRRIHFALTLVWLGPGALAAWWLRDSVPFVVALSWYAIVVSHLAGWAAETPVELEDGTAE